MNNPLSIPLPRRVVEAWSHYVLASLRHVLGEEGRSTHLDDLVTDWVISLDCGETALAVFAHALSMVDASEGTGLSVGLRALPEASGFVVWSFPDGEDCDCSVCTGGTIARTHWGCIVDRVDGAGGDGSLN